MEELTIKKEEIETEEFFLDEKAENISVKDEFNQEAQPNYEHESDQEMKIEQHEFSEDGSEKCDSTYQTEDHVQHTYEKVFHDTEKPFKCTECQHCCKTKGNLKFHILAAHSKAKPFKCSGCDYRAAKKSIITAHIQAVHTKEKPFKCTECQYCCKTKRNLKRHILAAHSKAKPVNVIILLHGNILLQGIYREFIMKEKVILTIRNFLSINLNGSDICEVSMMDLKQIYLID